MEFTNLGQRLRVKSLTETRVNDWIIDGGKEHSSEENGILKNASILKVFDFTIYFSLALFSQEAHWVTIIVSRNGIGNPCSNPGIINLSFTNIPWKRHE